MSRMSPAAIRHVGLVQTAAATTAAQLIHPERPSPGMASSEGRVALNQCKGTFSTEGALAGELKVTAPPSWLIPA